MKVLFFGYSEIGADALDVLHAQGYEVQAVVTHKDDPHEHRWYKTPAETARDHGDKVFYDDDPVMTAARLAEELRPDLVLSVMYRSMLGKAVLSTAKLAALNVHPSLLPAYRGRAPINWVLVNGERVTGTTLHHMVAKADAGDMVAQKRIEIAPRETGYTLFRKIQAASKELLAESLPLVAAGKAPRIAQDHSKATVFGRRRPEDGRINWNWPVRQIDCLVRAVAPPWPGTFAEVQDGKKTVPVKVSMGEPDKSPGPPTTPGALLRRDGKTFVCACDGWYRLDEFTLA
jgi:UDP-4-amino-4-deoxy-L-arabinose formyltransferase/UDP-glucuronic acid dehydrogenase (UDP-4-keto-hexauronic acid decarboxylating)